MTHSLSQRLLARYFAGLLIASGLVSALVHPLPNLTQMTGSERALITAACLLSGAVIWQLPWDRWRRAALYTLPPVGLAVKLWANLHGGLGPYSYSIHFVLIYVWIGVALPRGSSLRFSPLLAFAYAVPLAIGGDPRQVASMAMVVPICVLIGESVAWISNRLREVEHVDGQHMLHMRWLVQASVDLAHERDESALVTRIASLANERPGGDGAAVLLLSSSRSVEVAATAAWPSAHSLPSSFGLVDTPALLEAIKAEDFLSSTHPACLAFAEELGVPRVAIVRLEGSSRCVGFVLLAGTANDPQIDSFNRNLVRMLFVQSGLAIERTRDREALRDASLHDELTKLGNRRKANTRIESLTPGDALVMIDLDHFKRVNDDHGHAAGDRTLAALAEFLERTMREGDEAFRIGGEEFLVALAQSGEGAAIAGQRLCEGWRESDPVTTFSAGVAIHRQGDSSAQTLGRADEALYAAKAAGRDRVVVS